VCRLFENRALKRMMKKEAEEQDVDGKIMVIGLTGRKRVV
jgi:hypothetical protein